jgi:transcriptional regulator with XRE-family HTH domain
MIKENLKVAFTDSKLYVKEIAVKSGVNKSTIDGWMSARAYEPRPIDLYAVCKVVGITMEQAIDGDDGVAYVLQWAQKTGGVWKPPDKIADIVEDLLVLDDTELNMIRSAAHTAAEEKRGKDTSSSLVSG